MFMVKNGLINKCLVEFGAQVDGIQNAVLWQGDLQNQIQIYESWIIYLIEHIKARSSEASSCYIRISD